MRTTPCHYPAPPDVQRAVEYEARLRGLSGPRVWCWCMPPLVPYVSARFRGDKGTVSMPLSRFDASTLLNARPCEALAKD